MAWVARVDDVVEEGNSVVIKITYTDGVHEEKKNFSYDKQVLKTLTNDDIKAQIVAEGEEVKKIYERIEILKSYIGTEIPIP